MVIPAIAPIQPLPPAPPAGGSTPGGFAQSVTNALDQVQQTQNTASTAEAQAAAGQGSVTNALIDATQASLDTEVTVALLTKGITSFNEIMNMQF